MSDPALGRFCVLLGRTLFGAFSSGCSAPRAEGIPEGGWASAGDPDPGSSGGDIDSMAANTDLPFLTSDFNDAAAGTADVMGGNVVNLNAPPPPPGWAAFASLQMLHRADKRKGLHFYTSDCCWYKVQH